MRTRLPVLVTATLNPAIVIHANDSVTTEHHHTDVRHPAETTVESWL